MRLEPRSRMRNRGGLKNEAMKTAALAFTKGGQGWVVCVLVARLGEPGFEARTRLGEPGHREGLGDG